MKAIKKIKEAFARIDGKRLANATGTTLAIAFIFGTIIALANYAPAVLLIICVAGCIAFFYYLFSMFEDGGTIEDKD